MDPQRSIVVTGDISLDHHVFIGEPHRSQKGDVPEVHALQELGGAPALQSLLDKAMQAAAKASNSEAKQWTVCLGIEAPQKEAGQYHSRFALWKSYPKGPADSKDKEKVWRATADMSYQYTAHDAKMSIGVQI